MTLTLKTQENAIKKTLHKRFAKPSDFDLNTPSIHMDRTTPVYQD